MKYVNMSLPWMPDHHAMVPHLVENQLKTEKVYLIDFLQIFTVSLLLLCSALQIKTEK